MTNAPLRRLLIGIAAGAVLLILVVRLVLGSTAAGFDEALEMLMATTLLAVVVGATVYWVSKDGWIGVAKGALLFVGLAILMFALSFIFLSLSGRPYNN